MNHFRVCEMQVQFGFSEWMEQRLLARHAGSALRARISGALELLSMGVGLGSPSRAAQSHPPGAPAELPCPLTEVAKVGPHYLVVTLGSKMHCLQEMHPTAFCLGSGGFLACWGSRMLE